MMRSLRQKLALLLALLMVLQCLPLTSMAEIIRESSSGVQPFRAIVTPDATPYVTYEFYNSGELVQTQIVTNDDTLYAPATPENEEFIGWYIQGTDTLFTNFGVQSGITESAEITLEAKYRTKRYVFFVDDQNRVFHTIEVGSSGVSAAEISAVSFETDASHGILGWYTGRDGQGERVTSVSGDIVENLTLYALVGEGHWLYFAMPEDSSPVSNQFVRAGGVTTQPADPTRPGYTFAGWKVKDGADFTFGSALSENVTLEAKWTANTDTTYTVIIWKQSVSDDKNATNAEKTYDFGESRTATGATGATATASSADTSKSYTGFHYSRCDEDVTITGDGKAVVNVYYDRNLLTIYFEPVYNSTNSNSGTQYGLVNG